MKRMFSATILTMMVVLFVTSGFAQKQRSKDELLKEIATLSNSAKPEDKEKAYQTSKEFLARFGSEKNDNVKKIRDYAGRYRLSEFYKAVDGNKFSTAFSLGKEILADEPNNVEVLLNLTYAGYNALGAGDKAYIGDTISSAQKGEQLLDAGTTPTTYAPFKDKPEATAWIYYIEGTLVSTNDKKAGAASIYKAIKMESPIKENSLPYNMIALYYEEVYEKLGNDLKVKLAAKPVNEPEANALTDRITKALDLMLDAYARASTRANTENAPNKSVIDNRLAQIYKFVKKTDVGLAAFVTYINKTPLPDPDKF